MAPRKSQAPLTAGLPSLTTAQLPFFHETCRPCNQCYGKGQSWAVVGDDGSFYFLIWLSKLTALASVCRTGIWKVLGSWFCVGPLPCSLPVLLGNFTTPSTLALLSHHRSRQSHPPAGCFWEGSTVLRELGWTSKSAALGLHMFSLWLYRVCRIFTCPEGSSGSCSVEVAAEGSSAELSWVSGWS